MDWSLTYTHKLPQLNPLVGGQFPKFIHEKKEVRLFQRSVTELSSVRPWAFVNINVRPYYAEGSRTLAFETAEQLGWRAPARVVAPMASGSLYTKIWKGFQELHKVVDKEKRLKRLDEMH